MGRRERAVRIHEVGPRDGLQNEPEALPTDAKRELIGRLAAAGLEQIEVTSFVSPRWIPQLADADSLCAELPERPGLHYSALVPNARGYARFRAAPVLERAAVFISVSEAHNRRNVNCSVAEHLERLREVGALCGADGVGLRAYVSTAFGCVHEGGIPLSRVVSLVRALLDLGADEIALSDTIGVAHPPGVRACLDAVAQEVGLERIALHFHDTYGRAVANVQAGYEAGVRSFDASLGGLGGCPYAPGAAGNVATEDVVSLFESQGIATGVDLEALIDATEWLEREALGRPLGGKVHRAVQGRRRRDLARAD